MDTALINVSMAIEGIPQWSLGVVPPRDGDRISNLTQETNKESIVVHCGNCMSTFNGVV